MAFVLHEMKAFNMKTVDFSSYTIYEDGRVIPIYPRSFKAVPVQKLWILDIRK